MLKSSGLARWCNEPKVVGSTFLNFGGEERSAMVYILGMLFIG